MSSNGDQNQNEMDLGRLLAAVTDKGLKVLDLDQLEQLRALLESKSYMDKKANKSKTKLLKQINAAFYDRQNRHRLL